MFIIICAILGLIAGYLIKWIFWGVLIAISMIVEWFKKLDEEAKKQRRIMEYRAELQAKAEEKAAEDEKIKQAEIKAIECATECVPEVYSSWADYKAITGKM